MIYIKRALTLLLLLNNIMAVEYIDGWWTEWTNSYPSLTETQKQENALVAAAQLSSDAWTLEAIAGWLGNVFTEGLGNPGQWEIGYPIEDYNSYSGRGLVGWTPWWRLSDWLSNNGYNQNSGAGQMAKVLEEANYPNSEPGYVFWVTSYNGETNYFATYKDYTQGTLSPEEMAKWYMNGYERPGVPNLDSRQRGARKWYEFLQENFKPFEKRLDTETPSPMSGNKYYYQSAYNLYYPEYAPGGSGIPGSAGNCTWYAYGRFGEINNFEPYENHLSTGNAQDWYPTNQQTEVYEYGVDAKLGAIICFYGGGDGGHVAIVEEILDNGDVLTSNSAYGIPGTYFYTQVYSKSNGYNFGSFTFQGFIYSPSVFSGGGLSTGKIIPSWDMAANLQRAILSKKICRRLKYLR